MGYRRGAVTKSYDRVILAGSVAVVTAFMAACFWMVDFTNPVWDHAASVMLSCGDDLLTATQETIVYCAEQDNANNRLALVFLACSVCSWMAVWMVWPFKVDQDDDEFSAVPDAFAVLPADETPKADPITGEVRGSRE